MESIGGEIAFMAVSAGKAFLVLMEPHRLLFLGAGCIMGLVLGIIPGIGGLTGTAIVDPEGIYDPSLMNDRLLLGLKGTMSEFELNLFRQRSAEAIRPALARSLKHSF